MAPVEAIRQQIDQMDAGDRDRARQLLERLFTRCNEKVELYTAKHTMLIQDLQRQGKIGGLSGYLYKDVRANVSLGAAKGLGEIVDVFFAIGGGDSTGKDLKTAFSKLIHVALDSFFGSTHAEEAETTFSGYFVEGVAVVRVDAFVYKYSLRSDSIRGKVEDGTAYTASKSLVNWQAMEATERLDSATKMLFGMHTPTLEELEQVRVYVEKLNQLTATKPPAPGPAPALRKARGVPADPLARLRGSLHPRVIEDFVSRNDRNPILTRVVFPK